MINKKGYFENYKNQLLPWVEDWTDPQDHIRNETNINKLSLIDWAFCHPQGFKIIHYGMHLVPIILLTPLGFYIGANLVGIIILLFVFFNQYLLYKKWKLRSEFKNTTYYDIFMKEEEYFEVKGQYD